MAKATSTKDWRADADRRKELQAEYATVQGHYEDFDKRVLGLKGLATPLLGAGLAAGAKEHLPIVVWAWRSWSIWRSGRWIPNQIIENK